MGVAIRRPARIPPLLACNFGLRMRQEVKANELVKGSGPWATLGLGDRLRKDSIYRAYMRLQAKVGTVKTFAVVVDKSRCTTPDEVRATAWRHTLERVEAFARHNTETVMLLPDSGEYDRFRKLARQMRRFSEVGAMIGGGTLSRPLARYLIDDPVERDSAQSYMNATRRSPTWSNSLISMLTPRTEKNGLIRFFLKPCGTSWGQRSWSRRTRTWFAEASRTQGSSEDRDRNPPVSPGGDCQAYYRSRDRAQSARRSLTRIGFQKRCPSAGIC